MLEPLEDPDDLFLSTKFCPELKKHLDISICVDFHTMLLSSSNQNLQMIRCLKMANQAVHFIECNGVCRQCLGGVLTRKMLLSEFTWSDNRKYDSSENQILSRSSFRAQFLISCKSEIFYSADLKIYDHYSKIMKVYRHFS